MQNMKTLTIKRNKFGVDIQEVYFQPNGCPDTDCDLRVDFCVPEPSKHASRALTAVVDLNEDSETILAGFRRSYRREIQTGSDRDEFALNFTHDPRPPDIHRFCEAYDQFAQQQGLPLCNRNKLLFFAGQGALMLSSVRCAHSAHVLCQHAFIGDGRRARLLYSISSFRLYQYNSHQRNRIGRAHRLLHWADMNHFKQLDYTYYDLGGMAVRQNARLENINHFKRGFGGQERHEYVNFTPHNLKGWVAMQYLMRKL